MQASRLLSILMLLQARGRMSASALAQTLEVSMRTVLRDIDQLAASGVPIWSDRGRNGGFQLREGWSTELTGLTEPEANALVLAGLPSAATELGFGSAAISARMKMLASLPSEWREQADRVASCLHVDPLGWYQAEESPPFLREAAEAVWRGLRVEVTYESWSGKSKRELEPLGLVLKGGAWYLIARRTRTNKPLTFRMLNIESLSRSQRRFRRPTNFDLAAYWRESMARFERELYRLTARVAVTPRAENWFANARIKATRLSNERMRSSRKASAASMIEYAVPIESIEHGVRQFLSFGAEVKVLAPRELADAFARELAAIEKLYDKR